MPTPPSHAASILLAVVVALTAAPAAASDLSVGVGGAFGVDLPDGARDPQGRLAYETDMGLGGGLVVPIRLGLSPAASLRIDVRADHHGGDDVVTWDAGGVQRAWEQTRAWLFALGATVGPEVQIPLDGPVRPYLTGGIGAAVVSTYHSFRRCELMDPDANDCSDAGNIDPYTTQPAVLSEVAAGSRFGGDTFVWAEVGYSAAYLAERPLTKAEPSLDVRRAAYGWNALRLGVGVAFTL